jgi:hypothetical protein
MSTVRHGLNYPIAARPSGVAATLRADFSRGLAQSINPAAESEDPPGAPRSADVEFQQTMDRQLG